MGFLALYIFMAIVSIPSHTHTFDLVCSAHSPENCFNFLENKPLDLASVREGQASHGGELKVRDQGYNLQIVFIGFSLS